MTENLSDTETITVEVSSRGKRLRSPITVNVPRAERPGEKALNQYVIDAFSKKMPLLIKYTFDNPTILNIARHLLIHGSGSHQTLYQYVYGVYRFTETINQTPDQLIERCKTVEGLQDQQKTQEVIRQIDDFIGDLQAENLAPGTINNYVKGVKSLFQRNGLTLNLPFKSSKRVQYRDRAPTPEELQRIIDIGDSREKAIISILALSGMRIGTLVKLQYKDVMKDLENGITPVHLYIDASIVKGKYGSYDTFLGQEAVDYLRIYLDTRRQGTRKIPPETLTPDSPLIRDARKHIPTPITESQIHRIINSLFKKAGIIRQSTKRRYMVRPHSLRKYFKTQMTKLGTMNPAYIDYMMGHIQDTYLDIQSIDVEDLREAYRNSGLSIRPQTKMNKIETLRGVVMALGLDPNEVLNREAMLKPHRTIIDPMKRQEEEYMILSKTIRKTLLDELKSSRYLSLDSGSPAEIRTPV